MPIDLILTDALLRRLNGYFSVAEVMANLALGQAEMSPVRAILSLLAGNGLLRPGPVDAGAAQRLAEPA